MTANQDNIHLTASSHCALCHKYLPYSEDTSFVVQAWEYKVLGVCNLVSTSPCIDILTIPIDLADLNISSSIPITTKRDSTLLKMDICHLSECTKCERLSCPNLGRSMTDNIIYFVHRDCWKLVNALKTDHAVTLSLYKLARSTYPIFEYGDRLEHQKSFLTDVLNIIDVTNPQTELGQLLKSVSGLPVEVQFNVSRNCRWNLLSSLLITLHKSNLLLGLIQPDSSNKGITDIACIGAVDSISARLAYVYGQSYISELRFNETIDLQLEKQHSINVRRSKTKGVKFVVDRYGLRAISILYGDNSTSAWLGDEAGGWKGIIFGEGVRAFRIIHDDLKYLRITFIEKEIAAATAAKDFVLWDKDVCFGRTQSNQILEYIGEYLNEYANRGPTVRNYPGWRLYNYLPFVDGSGYMTGLTMYCDGHSITGMVAHGESSRLVGYRKGCPVHLPLQHNERIVSIWVRTPHDSVPLRIQAEPTILVTTSHHRTCIFGPQLSQTYSDFRQYAWTNLSQQPGCDILGIFFDALSVLHRHQITTIGVTQATEPLNSFAAEERPKIPLAQSMPPMRGTATTNSFVSIGTFCHVQQLKVCQIDSRYVGISIRHYDDTVEILGQWDPEPPSTISEIYSCNDGVLTSITFSFSGQPSKSHVEDISCGIAHEGFAENGHSVAFYGEHLRQPIAWWFTRTCDYVELWNGRNEDVVVSYRISRVMDLG